MEIKLIGKGPGNANLMTKEAIQALEEAEVYFGPERMLEGIDGEKYPYYLAEDILPVLEEKKPKRVAILFSGDASFYSGAKKLKLAFEIWAKKMDEEIQIRILPGISSISYLAAKLGFPYSDAFLFSLHGKKENVAEIAKLKQGVLQHEFCFCLLSGDSDIRLLGRTFQGKRSLEIYVGSKLSYANEKIVKLSPEEAENFEEKGLFVACMKNPQPEKRKLLPFKKDQDFIRDQVPMTKEVIRHESIIALEPQEGDIIYDIGSGSGSVSIELSALSDSLTIVAFEKKEEAILLQKKNMDKFGTSNIILYEGDVMEQISSAMEAYPPDKVFIGGSSGCLLELLRLLSGRGLRVVVTAVSLETISELSKIEKELTISDFSLQQIAVSKAKSLGDYHLLMAENPVMICSFLLA